MVQARIKPEIVVNFGPEPGQKSPGRLTTLLYTIHKFPSIFDVKIKFHSILGKQFQGLIFAKRRLIKNSIPNNIA